MNASEQGLPPAERPEEGETSTPSSRYDHQRRTITSRYFSSDHLAALDVVTYHDANAKAYRTRVQAVTNHPNSGESYIHDKRRWCSSPVARYSEKQHVAAARLALLALTLELPELLARAGVEAEAEAMR